MRERRVVRKILVGKPEGNRPLGRPRYRWDDNIKMVPQEVRLRDMDSFDLTQDRDTWRELVNGVINDPSCSIKCGEFLG
jgi:hypothetical protein